MLVAVGCIWNDKDILIKNLLNSPALWESRPSLFHINNPTSAAIGLNRLISSMEGDGFELGVFVHQDVIFPEGWFYCLENCLAGLPKGWFVAGVWGLRSEGKFKVHYGKIAEGRWSKEEGKFLVVGTKSLPTKVQALDECCLIFKLGKGFRFDERIGGFDLYGSEICLWAQKNRYSSWVINNFVVHNTKRSWDWRPDEIFMGRVKELERSYNTEVLSTVL